MEKLSIYGNNLKKKEAKRQEEIQKAKHLAPFTYVLGMKGKNFRRHIAVAFNYWYGVNKYLIPVQNCSFIQNSFQIQTWKTY